MARLLVQLKLRLLTNALRSSTGAKISFITSLVFAVLLAIGAFAVDLTLWARASDTITAADFQPAYLTIAAIAACASLVFAGLPADAGAELARRTTAPAAGPTEASDQRMG